MRVSVIIPAYNARTTIVSTIRSAVEQIRPADEIVVVDDGSTDGTADIIKRTFPQVRVYRQPNRGSAAARNLAVNKSSGDVLAFLDADDLWTHDKLEVQVPMLAEHPEAGMCFADFRNQFADGRLEEESFVSGEKSWVRKVGQPLACPSAPAYFVGREGLAWSLLENPVSTQTVIVYKSVFEAVGGFDESLRVGEDLDLWLRILDRYPAIFVDRVLCYRRLHSHNITRDPLRPDMAQSLILHRWLIRDVDWGHGQEKMFRDRLASLDRSIGRALMRRGLHRKARRYLAFSLRTRPSARTVLWMFLALLPKRTGALALRLINICRRRRTGQ